MTELHEQMVDLKQAVSDIQVVVKTRLGGFDQGQHSMSVRLEDLSAQMTRMEHDLAIIKEYLVTRMREGEQQGGEA